MVRLHILEPFTFVKLKHADAYKGKHGYLDIGNESF